MFVPPPPKLDRSIRPERFLHSLLRVSRATHRKSAALLLLVGALAGGCREGGASARDAPPPTVTVRDVATASLAPGKLTLPNVLTSVKFAVIGDSGRGSTPQYEVAAQMKAFREKFKYSFVMMVGDNIYEGPATEEDYRRKFEGPYRALLDDGVKFFAVLGNHDDPRQVYYAPFNMKGERYYSFVPPEDPLTRLATRVEFFGLDSTNLDRAQLQWLDERLTRSSAEWKIVFMHHPLYTSGRYRNSSRAHRWALEPLLMRHHVDAVFSGHEHIYQRSQLQNGIQYFVSGGAGSLRRGDGVPAPFIARTYDQDFHFMLVEIESNALHFEAISRTGEVIDAATLSREDRRRTKEAAGQPVTAKPPDTVGHR
jgi:predicted phosphodiesterase